MRLQDKLLNDEICSRARTSQTPARLFSDKVQAVLHRYELKQLTSAEVVERLVEIAKRLRDARRRHEQLGLSREEAAFYQALAGGVEDAEANSALAKIAHELFVSLRTDLTVDGRTAPPQKPRSAPRSNGCSASTSTVLGPHRGATSGYDGVDFAAQLVLDQAKALYGYWPDVEVGDRLFA